MGDFVQTKLRRIGELSRREVKNFFTLPPMPGVLNYTIHGLIVGVITLLTLAAVFSPIFAMPGLTGVFIAMSGRGMPPLRRLRMLIVFGLCYVAALSVGVAISGNVLVMVPVMALIGCVGSIVYQTLLTFPPGAMQWVIACAVATYLPTRNVDGPTLILAGAVGYLLAMCISLALQMKDPNGPMRKDLTAAKSAVAAMQEQDLSRKEAAKRRVIAHAALFTAWEDVRLGYGTGRELKPFNEFGREMNRQVTATHSDFVRAIVRRRWYLLGHDPDTAPEPYLKSPHLGPPSVLRQIKWSLSFRSMPVLVGIRMGLSIFLTGVLTYGLGFGHPYWAVMTAAIVLSVGKDRIATTHRGFDRVVGTLVGVGIFGLVHYFDPAPLVLLAICVLFYTATLFTIVRNYAQGSVWVTAMILLIITTVPTNYTVLQMIVQRAGETVLGAFVSLLVLWFTGWRAPIAIVRRQARRTLLADGFMLDYLADGTDLTGPGLIARRQVLLELSSARRLDELYARDLPDGLAEWEELSAAINEFSYVIMVACWLEDDTQVINARAARRELNDMIRQLPPIDGTPLDTAKTKAMLERVLEAARPVAGGAVGNGT